MNALERLEASLRRHLRPAGAHLRQQHAIGIACDGGLATWQCRARTVTVALFEWNVFGVIALGFAVLNLIRPTTALFGIGLVFTALGLVLHNDGLAGLAGAILLLSFARPVIEEA